MIAWPSATELEAWLVLLTLAAGAWFFWSVRQRIEYYVSAFLNAMYSAHDWLQKTRPNPLTHLSTDAREHVSRMGERRNVETHRLPRMEVTEESFDGRSHPKVIIVGNAAGSISVQVSVPLLRFTDGPRQRGALLPNIVRVMLAAFLEAQAQ